jgi:hypothetical protein
MPMHHRSHYLTTHHHTHARSPTSLHIISPHPRSAHLLKILTQAKMGPICSKLNCCCWGLEWPYYPRLSLQEWPYYPRSSLPAFHITSPHLRSPHLLKDLDPTSPHVTPHHLNPPHLTAHLLNSPQVSLPHKDLDPKSKWVPSATR